MVRYVLLVSGTAVLLAGLAYTASVELLAATHRASAAARPEVENWIMPYIDTAAPSLVTALGVFLIVVAIGAVAIALRGRRLAHD